MKVRKFNESINNEIFLSDVDENIRDMFQEFEDLDLNYTIKTGIYNGNNSKKFAFHNNDLRVLILNDGTYVSYLMDIKISDNQSFIDIKDNKVVDVMNILKNKQEYYDDFKFYMSLYSNRY